MTDRSTVDRVSNDQGNPQVLVVTGMSGAGRSTTAKVLEDLQYTVVDNLPPQLIPQVIQHHLPAETAVAIALANPMQTFRTASMMLFDPQLVLLGPSAYVILDFFGQAYVAWAMLYPLLIGTACAWLGYAVFRRGDLP